MEKLEMQSLDNVQANIAKIQQMFPNAVKEVKRDGKVALAIDFDILKQEMSDTLIGENEERYQMTWPDKRKSILLANTPTTKTLRPCKEESVNFDTTKNLYIEGDNLEVLKLLQETYLGKIKMIYIDPPYNTGSDFIYNDDFSQSAQEYNDNSGQIDEEGNRLVQNTESNGRFHTDWLNMIYPRLKVARDLLSDDGVIFISIDDYEIENLVKICNEIFGESNMVGIIHRRKNRKPHNAGNTMSLSYEFILVYYKNNKFKLIQEFAPMMEDEKGLYAIYPVIKADKKIRTYVIKAGTVCKINKIEKKIYKADRNTNLNIEYLDETDVVNGRTVNPVRLSARYCLTDENGKFSNAMNADNIFINENGFPKEKRYRTEDDGKVDNHHWDIEGGKNEDGDEEIKELFGISGQNSIFPYPKPVALLKKALSTINENDYIVLDFFSGSATTAHAVMQLNAEDGGNRRFILVQIPEPCKETTEAYSLGYKNICEIGKERIRRAGFSIASAFAGINVMERQQELIDAFNSVENGSWEDKMAMMNAIRKNQIGEVRDYRCPVDIGFRVLKLDESNMENTYYYPEEYEQSFLDNLVDNVKPDRTPLDLLFQVMLNLGKPLSSHIDENTIENKKVFFVNGKDLIACFDKDITEEVVKEIAKLQPRYVVFRDNSLSSDSVAINFDQIFATYSPSTIRKII